LTVDPSKDKVVIDDEIVKTVSEELAAVFEAQAQHWKTFVKKKKWMIDGKQKAILGILKRKKAFDEQSAYIGGRKLVNEAVIMTKLSTSSCNNALSALITLKYVVAKTIGKSEKGGDNRKYWLSEAGRSTS
jgi:hypothetical protein